MRYYSTGFFSKNFFLVAPLPSPGQANVLEELVSFSDAPKITSQDYINVAGSSVIFICFFETSGSGGHKVCLQGGHKVWIELNHFSLDDT